jgi:YYY domain-containing protein
MVVTGIQWPSSIPDFFDSANSSLNPYNRGFGTYVYGTFPLFVAKALGALLNNTVYGDAHLPGRYVSALLDVLTVGVTWQIGRLMFSPRVGLLAAALGAGAVLQIQSAHYFTADSSLVFFCSAAFWAMLTAERTSRWYWWTACGLCCALAVASKVSGAPVMLLLALPLAERFRRGGWHGVRRSPDGGGVPPLTGLAIGVFTAIWTFRFAQPYAFAGPNLLDFRLDERWLADLRYWRKVQSGIIDTPPNLQWVDRTPVLFSLRNHVIWGMGPLLGLTALGGLALVLWRLLRSRSLPSIPMMALVAWPVFHLVWFGMGFVQTMRYALPAYPFLMILAAVALDRSAAHGETNGWKQIPVPRLSWTGRTIRVSVAMIPAAIVVATTLIYAAGFTVIYERTTTREAASRWMYENIPPGTVIATEHWDDGLPISFPGFLNSTYKSIQMELFYPDDQVKLDTLISNLEQVDYITISSNRLYGTIPRAAERYPLTTAYYDRLFDGSLGFDLVHSETSYPSFLGIDLIDDGAEESFTVYEHPKVYIFRKSERFDIYRVRTALAPTIANPPVVVPLLSIGQNQLLMDESTRITQQSSGTWSALFNVNSLANRAPIVIWYLVLQLMALTAVPLCWRLLPGSAEAGWAAAKTAGLLVTSYVAWILASTQAMAFGPDSVLIGVLATAALSFLAVRTCRTEMLGDFRLRARNLVATELVFAGAFAGAVAIRMQNPDLWHRYRGGEKPMDFAFFNAVLKSTWFPAYDPWFAGGYLHYYSFGFVQWASLTRLTGIVPEVAYNLAIASVFALVCTTVWAIALVALARLGQHEGELSYRYLPLKALLAPMLVAIVGNLDLALRIGRGEFGYPASGFWSSLPALAGVRDLGSGIWSGLTVQPQLPTDVYWPSTRVIPGTINEFPYFSFLFGDLHAHVMAMPLAGLAILFAWQFATGPKNPDQIRQFESVPIITPLTDHLRWVCSWARSYPDWYLIWTAVLSGFLANALFATNTWDFPTYFGLLTLGVAVCESARADWTVSYRLFVRIGTWIALAYALGYLLFSPFHASFSGTNEVIRVTERSSLSGFLTVHGAFMVIVGGYLVLELARVAWSPVRLYLPWQSRALTTTVLLAFGLPLLAVLAIGLLAGSVVLLLLSLILLSLVVAWFRRQYPVRLMVALTAGTGFVLALSVEIVALGGDVGRMNTVFKVYLQVWLLLALVGAVALGAALSCPKRSGPGTRIWLGACGFLILAAALYPIVVTRPRLGDRFEALDPTLNGMAYMAGARYTDEPTEGNPVEFPLSGDLAAIEWMRKNIAGSPVVLEATLPGYKWGSRISVYTGLPTVLGWDWHETQQRRGFGELIARRKADVERLYSTDLSFDEALVLLNRYHVQYIYIGDLERAWYPEAGLTKFESFADDGLLEVVYEQDGVTIYRVIPRPDTLNG